MTFLKRIAVLGSTGSIGQNTLDVARRLPGRCAIAGLGARSDWEKLNAQIEEFRPSRAALADESAFSHLRSRGETRLLKGPAGLVDLATADDVDVVLSAITGYAGLEPGLAALRAGKTLALAN